VWTDSYTLREASANPPLGPAISYLGAIFVTSRVSRLRSGAIFRHRARFGGTRETANV
jgi:hypothetical protein